MHGRPAKRRRSAIAGALLASACGHAVVAWLVIPRLSAPVVVAPPRPPLEIVLVEREVVFPLSPVVTMPPASSVATRRGDVSNERPKADSPGDEAAPRTDAEKTSPSASPAATPAGGVVGILAERRDQAIREALSPTGERLVPWRGLTGTPGGPRSPTDSIDGIPHLGTGEPGDPRVRGSGNVDIAVVVQRDGLVAQAQERARQGQVHPFLGAVKERVEECWLPVVADADSVTRYVAMEDGVCAKGFHLRRNVGRVHAIYDPKGTRLAIELDTGADGSAAVLLRRIQERVARAFDEAGMREVPPELLDENGLLRVAWNVYIDDYRGCDLQGRGANAHKPGGDEIIGIVELDGLY